MLLRTRIQAYARFDGRARLKGWLENKLKFAFPVRAIRNDKRTQKSENAIPRRKSPQIKTPASGRVFQQPQDLSTFIRRATVSPRPCRRYFPKSHPI